MRIRIVFANVFPCVAVIETTVAATVEGWQLYRESSFLDP